jgi:hypothetical protein
MQPIQLTNGQTVRGFGFSRYANKITIGTARGYASRYNEDPEAAHNDCLKRGHETAWAIQKSSALTADYAGKAEDLEKELQEIRDSVILDNNQLVTIEGETFKVRLAGERYSDPIHFVRI